MMYSDADTALFVVHEDEMTAEMAEYLAEAAAPIAEQHICRLPDEVDDTPGFALISLLVPGEEIPGGKPAHVEYADDVITVMYDEQQITRALAGAIEALAAEISKLYRAN